MNKVVSNVIILSLLCYGTKSILTYNYENYKIKNSRIITVNEEYRNLDCLTENIYYEASNQSLGGKIAVAQVTLNRVKVSKGGSSICSVVHAKNQFSWTSEKPKSLINIDKKAYQEAREVAKKVLFENEKVDCVSNSIYYHTTSIKPHWDYSKIKTTCVVGSHIFYKDA